MLDPALAARLNESPDIQDFKAFLYAEMNRLNDLSALKDVARLDIPLEVKSRNRAFEILTDMLAPLLGAQSTPSGLNPQEYVA